MDSIVSLITPKKSTFYIEKDSTVRQALEKFDAHKFSVVPMIDGNGEYIGTLSEGDILRYIKNHHYFDVKVSENTRIDQIEHYRPYKALGINATMMDVYKLSLSQNFVPLIDDKNHFIGIIKRSAILKYFVNNFDKFKEKGLFNNED